MNRKIWNQFTTAVLCTAIGATMSIVGSAEATLGSTMTDLVATGQSDTEPVVQSTTENQSTTVDTRNNLAPSQPQPPKPNVLETPGTQPTSPAVAEPGILVKPTSHSVPVTDSQPKKAAETRPTSNHNAAPAKKTQPTRIDRTSTPPKPATQATKKPQPAKQPIARAKSSRRQGMASWYGPGFNGRRTASGERFNQHGMTAAHRSLPMGTKVKVTNLNNGRSVVVRINDRGPFGGGRIIDLSHGAAKLIGVVRSGVAPVLLEVLGR